MQLQLWLFYFWAMSVLRQLKDIQAQAENLEDKNTTIQDFEAFGKYSSELKEYLLQQERDDFVLKLVNEIPELDISKLKGKDGGLLAALSLVANALGASIINDHQKKLEALEVARTIKGKYASIEFIYKNNL